MLYSAILVHVLDLLMIVANQPKDLKKKKKKKKENTQHFKKSIMVGHFVWTTKENPFEYLMWKLFVVMLH